MMVMLFMNKEEITDMMREEMFSIRDAIEWEFRFPVEPKTAKALEKRFAKEIEKTARKYKSIDVTNIYAKELKERLEYVACREITGKY